MQQLVQLDVLGWQLRIKAESVGALWPLDRRERYLLDPRIETPLSADPAVWPLSGNDAAHRYFFADYFDAPHSAPNGLGLFALRPEIWSKLQDARPGNDYDIAGIAVDGQCARRLRQRHQIVKGSALTAEETANISILGFDVCDDWLTSGLLNLGLDRNIQQTLRNRFGKNVNTYGLFDDDGAARAFGLEISSLAPEHAPFFAVGVLSLNLQ